MSIDLEPHKSGRVKRIAFWVALAVVAIVLGTVIVLARPSLEDAIKPALSPDNPAPGGSQAIAEVLKDHGIDLKRTTSRTDAARDSAGATLVVPSTPALSVDAFNDLIADASVVVLVSPSSAQLGAALDGTTEGYAGEAVSAGCSVDMVSDLGDITIGSLYAAPDAISCYPYDGGAGLLIAERDGQTIYVFDGASLLSNATVGTGDNAALALRILSQQDTLVWYVATAKDTDADPAADTSLGGLTPSWVTPVIVLLAAAALSAIWWRGKRFGPLVLERLPVTVKISETLEGRAKLYAQSRDTAHAGRVLREASVRSLARMLGLGKMAPADTVARAVAGVLAMNLGDVENLLAGPAPHSDAALMELSDRLIHLEAAITAAFRTERTPS